MYGFLPGFCYLGGLPKELTVSRRPTIRAAASDRHHHDRRRHGADHDLRDADRLVAGRPHAGAHVLARRASDTFLAAVGDEIKFEPIDLDTFHALDAPRRGGRDRRQDDEAAHERGAHHHRRGAGRDAAGRRPPRLSALRRHRGGADGSRWRWRPPISRSGAPTGATAIEVSLGGIEVTRGRRDAAGRDRRRQFRRDRSTASGCRRRCGLRSRPARSCASAPAPTARGAISRSAARSTCRRCSAPTRRIRARRSAASTAAR